jgi:hypothetical protein
MAHERPNGSKNRKFFGGAPGESRNRSLHLLDIENLVGVPPREASCECYGAAFADYLRWVEVAASDQLVWASNPANVLKGTRVAQHMKVLPAKGPDGADIALRQYAYASLGVDKIKKDFSTVYIGSGDHIFADLVADLLASGVDVCVVGRARQVSSELESASRYKVIYLPEHYHRSNVLVSLSDAALIESFLRRRAPEKYFP